MARKDRRRLSVFLITSVLAGPVASHVSAQIPVRVTPGQRVSKSSPGDARPINIRVQIAEGVFGVFDSSPLDVDTNAPVPHVALWLDFDSYEVLYFDSLLYEPYEVGESIRQLEETILGQPLLRDWLELLESTEGPDDFDWIDWLFPPWPADAPEHNLGSWRQADAEQVSALIGFRIATLPDPMYTPPGNVAGGGVFPGRTVCPYTHCVTCGGQCCLSCEGGCCGVGCCDLGDDCCLWGECCAPPKICCDGGCRHSPECCEDWHCDDGNPCTSDLCEEGDCEYIPNVGNPCVDDGNTCTDDVCSGGVCTHPPGNEGGTCEDDGNDCTADVCVNGVCAHLPNSDPCDDGDPCTTDDHCALGFCGGDPMDCDDANPCTQDSCDAGACIHEGTTGPSCDDGDPCTTSDQCINGVCSGEELDCDDGDLCTEDVCNNGACEYSPNNAACADDGNVCTDDVCSDGACTHPPGNDGAACTDDGSPCTDDYCAGGVCTHPPGHDGAACDDGDPCTENDQCSGGSCAGDPIDCDDSDPCTEDSCGAGGCVHDGLTGPACDDEDPCTIDDECTLGVCEGRQKDCSDSNPCTTDACDPDTGACTHANNTASCDDCDPCTSGDQCQNGICAGTTPTNAASGAACATCPLDVVVDGEGYGAGVAHTCDTQVTIPQGTICVLLRVYYYSREYSTWTGQQSIYDDQLSFEASYPSGLVASGDTTVNALHDLFGPGPYPGGNYLVVEELLDYESLTALGDSWLDLSASATNVSDGLFGSGVAFEVECCEVTVLEWDVPANSGNLALDDCPNNDGARIFPGKLSSGDENPAVRRTVDLVATVQPVVPGIDGRLVYFKVWDVDDPFDQNNNTMPNVGLIDNDTTGPDNRPNPEPPVSLSSATDAQGVARVTFTVSMQPGNNYRTAVSLSQDGIAAPTQTTADAINNQNPAAPGAWTGTSDGVFWSPMLTVWRKLWIERDTMAAPDPTELDAFGTITEVQLDTPATGLSTLRLSPDATLNLDLNHYEEGSIVISACPFGSDTFPVVESGLDAYTKNGIPILEVLGLPGPCATSSPFTLQDDDDPIALGTASNPRYPSGGSLLGSAYQPAYILPAYALTEYSHVVPFEEYLDAFEIDFGQGTWNDFQDLTSTDDFWAWFVVGAWEGSGAPLEPSTDSDGDPDFCFNLLNPPDPRAGAETPVTGVTDVQDKVSVILLQALADDLNCIYRTDEAHTVVHEIGHAHSDHVHGGIMEEGAPRNQDSFTAQSLANFRAALVW